MNEYIIDRIEDGKIAVCETSDGQVEISLSELPKEVKSGDIIIKSDNGYVISDDLTKLSRQRNIAILNRLKGKK